MQVNTPIRPLRHDNGSVSCEGPVRMLQAPVQSPSGWDTDLVRRYDLSGPRYTSYPTAPHFLDSLGSDQVKNLLRESNRQARPLSLYTHIPFCDTLCYYCGCHKTVSTNKSRSLPYLQGVIKEMAIYGELIDASRPVKQLHWGGGTPTYISDEEMSLLMTATGRYFQLLDDDSGEYGIEIHPGRVSIETMLHLRKLGFNRVSMGIQDFDLRVQQAVNRFNSLPEVTRLVKALRQQCYHSLSMDLIYGLPLQTETSFSETLHRVIELSPDRLSIFNYAHLPEKFKSQRMIREADLPSGQQKLDIFFRAMEILQAAGYLHLGMDHFAKPDDGLGKALQDRSIQRNFQGYSTHGDCDLLAFGVSSISSLAATYYQNTRDLSLYQQCVNNGELPISKSCRLSDDDLLRRYVINQIICHGELDFADVETRFGINAMLYFTHELFELDAMVQDGLLSIGAKGLQVLPAGRLLVRRICMVFDRYLQRIPAPVLYSKII